MGAYRENGLQERREELTRIPHVSPNLVSPNSVISAVSPLHAD